MNISDFWRRWHMSLSSWFRDYLFIPLGGSQQGTRRTIRNLVITMFLAGLWHGAAWTFVVWGLVHGAFLAGHAVFRRVGLTPSSAGAQPPDHVRARLRRLRHLPLPGLAVAGDILSSMVGLHGLDPAARIDALLPLKFTLLLGALLLFVNLAPNTWQIRLRPRVWRAGLAGVAAAAAIITISQPHPFIYFQF